MKENIVSIIQAKIKIFFKNLQVTTNRQLMNFKLFLLHRRRQNFNKTVQFLFLIYFFLEEKRITACIMTALGSRKSDDKKHSPAA